MVDIISHTTAMDSIDHMDMSVIGAALRNEKIANALSISNVIREHRQQHPSSETLRSRSVEGDSPPVVETPTPKPRESRSSLRNNPSTPPTKRSKSIGRWLGLRNPTGEEEDVPAGEESKPSESKPSHKSRSSSRDVPSAFPTRRRSKSTARSKKSKDDPSRESRSSSRGEDQSSNMTRSKSLVSLLRRRNLAGKQENVTVGEESKTSESKPSRESRWSARVDPSAPMKPMKRPKSTGRSNSKGPIGRSKENPLEASPTKKMRTIIRVSARELIEAGFDPANMPTRAKSPRTSKGGKERIRISGLDAKDMAARVLVKSKSKKKENDEPKEIPMEV
jgi:hypothetical protein